MLQVGVAPKGNSDNHLDVGPWAQEKLDCLQKYLQAYTAILGKQQFKGYFYIDAFAGPGTLKVRKEQTDDPAQQSLLELSEDAANDVGETLYINGSPNVALKINPSFTHYVFVELDQERVLQLEALKAEHEGPDRRIRIRNADCNTYLRELLRNTRGQWRQWRGVIFLDPFGMQVPWETIAEIGRTKSIEVFINFPVGMAIQRLLRRSGDFTPAQRSKLDQYFGTSEWYELLYRQQPDMFGENRTKIQNSSDVLVKWYCRRLKEAFGHVSSAREICSTQGHPLYYLIFAGPNKTGMRIANDILRQGARMVR